MKILIVDDEPDTITFLGTWLQDHGYETCSAMDGKQGMEAILAERPNLVLLDIKMPHQTGVQLYRDIKLHDACKDIPVIFITGMGDFHMFDKGCGPLPEPAACIEKPINLSALGAAIKKALG
jgi:two-component system cell cycle response regulator DivK